MELRINDILTAFKPIAFEESTEEIKRQVTVRVQESLKKLHILSVGKMDVSVKVSKVERNENATLVTFDAVINIKYSSSINNAFFVHEAEAKEKGEKVNKDSFYGGYQAALERIIYIEI